MPSFYRRQCPGASSTLCYTDAVAFPVLVWTARTAGRGTSIGSDFHVIFMTMSMYNLVRKTENDILSIFQIILIVSLYIYFCML